MTGRLKLRFRNLLVNAAVMFFGGLPILVGFGAGSLLAGLAALVVSVIGIGVLYRAYGPKGARRSSSV